MTSRAGRSSASRSARIVPCVLQDRSKLGVQYVLKSGGYQGISVGKVAIEGCYTETGHSGDVVETHRGCWQSPVSAVTGSSLMESDTVAAQPPHTTETGPAVSRESLRTDLLAGQQRCQRLAARNQQLEKHLSELRGEQTWHATGLGAATDIDQLEQRIITLEQQAVDLRLQLEERDQDLTAARAGNR